MHGYFFDNFECESVVLYVLQDHRKNFNMMTGQTRVETMNFGHFETAFWSPEIDLRLDDETVIQD